MAEETICEICEREEIKLADCRKCKAKVCKNCIMGTKCVDCVSDEEDDGGGLGRFDVKGY